MQRRRDKEAAQTCFRKRLKRLTSVPRVMMTDSRASYGAAKRELMPSVGHRQHRYVKNRAENLHSPTRQRERRMQGVKASGHPQRVLSAYGPIVPHFRPRRHLLPVPQCRQEMPQRLHTWQDITRLPTAALEDDPGSHAPSCSLSMSTGDKLTTPSARPRIAPQISTSLIEELEMWASLGACRVVEESPTERPFCYRLRP
jgi:hypothetical protein